MKRLLLCLICLTVSAAVVFADGIGPQRKMTAAEASANDAVRAAVQAALPPAPNGYSVEFRRISEVDEGMVPEALPAGGMLGTAYRMTCSLVGEGAAEMQQAAFMDQARGTPEQQKKMAELDAKEAELKAARDASHSPAEKQKIRTELKALRDEQSRLSDEIAARYQQWLASGGAQAATESVMESAPPKELAITVRINQSLSVSDKSEPCAVAGVPAAFAVNGAFGDQGGFCVVGFVGGFDAVRKVSGYTLYQPRNAKLDTVTKVRSLAFIVNGPKDKGAAVRDFAGKIDVAKLKALLP